MSKSKGNSGGPVWSSMIIILLTIGASFLSGFAQWGEMLLIGAGVLLCILGLIALIKGSAFGGIATIAIALFFLPLFCFYAPKYAKGQQPKISLDFPKPLLEKVLPFLQPSAQETQPPSPPVY